MEFTESIKDSVCEIFSSMVLMNVEPMDGLQVEDGDEKMLTGIVGFAGELQGTVLIHMPEYVAVSVVSSFMGMELEEVDEDVKDAIGELANMLAGGIKFHLPGNGQNIQLSIPSVVSGRGYTCEATGKVQRTALQFETPDGRFITELLTRTAVQFKTPRGKFITEMKIKPQEEEI